MLCMSNELKLGSFNCCLQGNARFQSGRIWKRALAIMRQLNLGRITSEQPTIHQEVSGVLRASPTPVLVLVILP